MVPNYLCKVVDSYHQLFILYNRYVTCVLFFTIFSELLVSCKPSLLYTLYIYVHFVTIHRNIYTLAFWILRVRCNGLLISFGYGAFRGC